MKISRTFREVFAVVLVVLASVYGFSRMIIGESRIDLSFEEAQNLQAVQTMIDTGLIPYFIGIGVIFFTVAVAYILMEQEEPLSTILYDTTKKG